MLINLSSYLLQKFDTEPSKIEPNFSKSHASKIIENKKCQNKSCSPNFEFLTADFDIGITLKPLNIQFLATTSHILVRHMKTT